MFGGDEIDDALDADPPEIGGDGDTESSDPEEPEVLDEATDDTDRETAVSGFDDDGLAAGQARDGHETDVEVDVSDEAIREARLRAVYEARDRVQQYRSESAERGFEMQRKLGDRDASQLRALGLRQRVVAYAETVEPLLARTRVGRELYTELHLGEVDLPDVEPDDPPGRGRSRSVDRVETKTVEVVGIKDFIETGPIIRDEVSYQYSPSGFTTGKRGETETVAEPVPAEISSRAYRAINGYLEEIGLDLEASHGGGDRNDITGW